MMMLHYQQQRRKKQQRCRNNNSDDATTRSNTTASSIPVLLPFLFYVLVVAVAFVQQQQQQFQPAVMFVEGGIIQGFKRDKLPMDVTDVLQTFDRAQRFQRHLQQQAQEEMNGQGPQEASSSGNNDNNGDEVVGVRVVVDDHDHDHDHDSETHDGSEEVIISELFDENSNTIEVAVSEKETTMTAANDTVVLAETEDDDAGVDVITNETENNTNNNAAAETASKPIPISGRAEGKNNDAVDVTGPRGGREDPSPHIEPTEISFMILMDEFAYSMEGVTESADVRIGTKFAFTGRIATKAEELGTATGSCTVTSDIKQELSFCEIYHKIDTDNFGGFGIVTAAGTADEVGGRLLVTGTGGTLSNANQHKGYELVQFDPAGNPVLYVLLKLF